MKIIGTIKSVQRKARRSPWLLGLAWFAAAAPTQAADISWTNLADGFWTNASNWSTGTVPGTNDNVFITNNATITISLNVNATIASLTLGGASGTQTLSNYVGTLTLLAASSVGSNGVFVLGGSTLAGNGPLTVNGLFEWLGGNMRGRLYIATSASLNLGSAITKDLPGLTLVNNGTVVWAGGQIRGNGATVITNNGLWRTECDNSINSAFGGTYVLHNTGTYRNSVTTGTTSFSNVALDNTGAIEVATGTIQFGNDLTLPPSSVLRFLVAGKTANAQYGRIASAGTLTVNGALDILLDDSFAPVVGDAFQILSFNMLSNNFSQITGLDLGGGAFLQAVPAANSYSLAARTVGLPTISVQPQSQSLLAGRSAMLTVAAVGTTPFGHQWRFNGTDISGANSDTLPILGAQDSDAGNYGVVVNNTFGSVTSRVATVKVLFPPVITQQPASTNVAPGDVAIFSVVATGSPTLAYQWRLNGVNLPGATNFTLSIPSVQVTNGGLYSVVVANPASAVTSEPARLFVDVPQVAPGDNFADRTAIFGTNSAAGGTNLFATREPGEPTPAHKSGGKSVWYVWRAPISGIATFRTTGSSFDTLLGVYRGTVVNNLTVVTSDEDSGGFLSSKVAFNAVAGADYNILIDGFAGAAGNFVLSWQMEATPDTLPVIAVEPESQTVTRGSNATFVVISDAMSYRWLFNGTVITGAISSSLTITNVQTNHVGRYSVLVTKGTRSVESEPAFLEIGVDAGAMSDDKFEDLFGAGGGGAAGGLALAASSSSAFVPVTAGTTASQILNNTGASTQPGEPNHCGVIGGASKWFGLQPTDAGILMIDTLGSDIDTVLAVYTGMDLLSLQLRRLRQQRRARRPAQHRPFSRRGRPGIQRGRGWGERRTGTHQSELASRAAAGDTRADGPALGETGREH